MNSSDAGELAIADVRLVLSHAADWQWWLEELKGNPMGADLVRSFFSVMISLVVMEILDKLLVEDARWRWQQQYRLVRLLRRRLRSMTP